MMLLSKENKKWFVQIDFDKWKITNEEIGDLKRKRFLKEEILDPNGEHKTRFYLLDSAYMFLTAKETEKTSEATRELTERLLQFTALLIVLTVIQIIVVLADKFRL
jgi:hypothetical protein